MELNLRKARKLEAKIQQFLDENPVDVTASVRSLGTLEEALTSIDKSKKEAFSALKERENLLNVRYDIRRQIEEKNEVSGINVLVNDKVATDKVLKDLNSIPNSKSPEEVELSDQLKVHSVMMNGEGKSEDVFSRPRSSSLKTSFKVHVFSKEDLETIESKKADLKKKLEDIEDSINHKNLSNMVLLPEDTLKLLQSKRLI